MSDVVFSIPTTLKLSVYLTSLQVLCLLPYQAYHESLLDHPLAPLDLLVLRLHPLILIPDQVPWQHHLGVQARSDKLRRKSCRIKPSSGNIRRTMKRIMKMCLGNRMRPVSWLAECVYFGACQTDNFVAATELPMQTLQLNTRLSNKSGVNQFALHYSLKNLHLFCS